jgi:hypothetical protein
MPEGHVDIYNSYKRDTGESVDQSVYRLGYGVDDRGSFPTET